MDGFVQATADGGATGWLPAHERSVLYMGPEFLSLLCFRTDVTLREEDPEYAHQKCFHLDVGCRKLLKACRKASHSLTSLGKP
jgi:hypothetical protein